MKHLILTETEFFRLIDNPENRNGLSAAYNEFVATVISADAPPLRWTGKASDLVELIYGISEMGCINGGEASLKEIASYCYKVFGVQAKGCYHIYNDIKMRKNESRTYFLDRAAEKVNRRMLLDEERERMRR